MPIAVFMIGLPGSGKTTYALEHYAGYAYISTDKHIERWANQQGKKYEDVFKARIMEATALMVSELEEATWRRQNVVIDQTNLTPESRRKKSVLINHRDEYELHAVQFPIDRMEQEARLKMRINKFIDPAVLENFRRQLKLANKGEGFSKIITIGAARETKLKRRSDKKQTPVHGKARRKRG